MQILFLLFYSTKSFLLFFSLQLIRKFFYSHYEHSIISMAPFVTRFAMTICEHNECEKKLVFHRQWTFIELTFMFSFFLSLFLPTIWCRHMKLIVCHQKRGKKNLTWSINVYFCWKFMLPKIHKIMWNSHHLYC